MIDGPKTIITEGDEVKTVEKTEEVVEEWAPWNLVLVTKNPNAPPPVNIKAAPGPAWDIGQVLKAAKLLCKPPLDVNFADEQEMRCVYSLIYDVFRYKSILDQAIEDTDFFGDYPQLSDHRHSTWLFLMELARRQWVARSRGDADRATRLLNEAGFPFKDVESAVWDQRVHFAAAIARIRIKNRAFSLSALLPPHLREERISACVNKDLVTGWVNTFKAKKIAALVERLHELGYSYSNSRQLCAGEYRFDRVCPRFITLRPPQNVSIGQLDLVKEGIIVLQGYSMTYANMSNIFIYTDIENIYRLVKRLIFPVKSYVCALRDLGIEASELPQSSASVCVLSDPVHFDNPKVASALDGVVAALATPPNSYSAVTDPIDLVCGRGGDLAMLEILTESEIDSNGKARVQSILEEQKKTLKTLMSKPQIQLILYETHSALEAENQAQVTRAVAEANRLARERHALLKKKHKEHVVHKPKEPVEAAITESCSSLDQTASRSDLDREEQDDEYSTSRSQKRPMSSPPTTARTKSDSGETVLKKRAESADVGWRSGPMKSRPIPEMQVPEDEVVPRDPDKDSPNIYVPDGDLFEIQTLPNIGNGLDINYILDRDGCYLGLIQRKEITRLDAKYMIRVAEERGLFGAAPAPRRRRPEPPPQTTRVRRRKNNTFEVGRVSAPTYASMSRSRRSSAPACVVEECPVRVCSRHARRHAAATAFTAASCTCDARHKSYKTRRVSDVTSVRPPSPPCRQPFPLAVHDLRLKMKPQDLPI
ncbi:hypothetical protein KGM_205183 [Danaus plexippus plexippus]|uniref:Uncharacterized protein n=1 Tax=Danaus plexippus plexippus TaxID=278856 RepID=A0A212EY68_DANPL|nr:hypothetical protein KGM_205183 [Danaus plexippus plexippus]